MLDVLAELPELTLHAFPRTACRDAHLLVVVAGRAAGGKGIVQPEVVLGGDVVGDVGEGCRAFVGGDYEVWIVAVVRQHVPGGPAAAVYQVVGATHQEGHVGLVTPAMCRRTMRERARQVVWI